MSRLIVVSNRVALPRGQQSGGLAVALSAALREEGGIWFGFSGNNRAEASGQTHEESEGNIRYVTMDLSRADHDAYYNGFANRTLWPLLHFRLDLVDYSRETYAGYRRVNELFADRLAKLVREDDLVWIHDYHLFPLGAFLRERGVTARMGFFLHVPLPSSDLLAALPDHERVFARMTAYDLIGLQTQRDLERFQDYLRLHAHGRVHADGDLEDRDGRRFRACAFPISIETRHIAEQAASAMRNPAVRRLARSLVGRQLVIGVDRLDYSKGLPQRLQSFGRLLERNSSLRGRISMLQIATASRTDVPEYRDLRRKLERESGHINGQHADPDWVPIRYVNRGYPHSTLTGFYRLARIGLVTPFRDGMNLVAKEFVAAQDPDDPGVLVLSRFAGAAQELDQALLVNPYDIDGIAHAIQRAAEMPLAERQSRWTRMMQHLERHDIDHWRRSFLEQLRSAPPPRAGRARGTRATIVPVPTARRR